MNCPCCDGERIPAAWLASMFNLQNEK